MLSVISRVFVDTAWEMFAAGSRQPLGEHKPCLNTLKVARKCENDR